MIVIALFFSALYYKFDITAKKIFAWPTIVFIILYGISFDVIHNPQIEDKVFVFFHLKPTIRSYYYFFVTSFSFLIGIFLTRYYNISKYKHIEYNYLRLKRVYYWCAAFALIGFAINLHRVIGNMSLLFISPRTYEAQFGASTMINYLYFMNVPALCLYVFLKSKNYDLRFSKVINCLMVLVSFFHGIKFTIFDTIAYPAILYFLLHKSIAIKKILLILGCLFGVFILFATYVRGSSDESPILTFICYIIPNFYNLDYLVENMPNSWGDFGRLITPEQMASPTRAIGDVQWPKSFFIFNDAFNMPTSLAVPFLTFNIFAPLIYIPIFYIQYVAYRVRHSSLMIMFFSTYMEYCLAFAFYFYAYTKVKNIYYVVLFIIIDYYCRKRK